MTSLFDSLRTQVNRRRARAFFDEPAGDVHAGITAFRGWVASLRPIESIALEIDGRADMIASRLPRADVVAKIGLPYVAGWDHQLLISAFEGRPRRFSGRIFVNGALTCSKIFRCTGEPPSKPAYAGAPDASRSAPRDLFLGALARFSPEAMVLEAGTKQSVTGQSTHWFGHSPALPRCNYTMMDIEAGADVDIVADLHALPETMTGRFDAFIANAVFEHLERPWIAAKEIARILKPGGLCYVGTHQTFPLHGYPSDFFRFSVEALSLIFRDAGLDVIDAAYENRAQILAPSEIVPAHFTKQWNDMWPSYIAVHVFARKPR